MYPVQVKKIQASKEAIEAVIDWLQEKIENAGESDKAQERASALEDVVASLEQAASECEEASSNLEGIE